MNIEEINWGDDSAERDIQLNQYFVESISFKRIISGLKKIIVGRKGSGKSALMKMSYDKLTEDGHLVVKITPSLDVLKSALQTAKIMHDEGSNCFHNIKDVIYTHAWLSYVYERVLLKIGSDILKSERKLDRLTGSRRFSVDLANNLNMTQKTLSSFLVDILNGLKIDAGKFGKVGVDFSIGDIQSRISELSKAEIYKYHISELIDEYKVAILVDDLDQGWDGSEESNSLTKGIMYALDKINVEISSIKTVLFIREDMYGIALSEMQHSDKYRNIERIKWDSDGLKEILNKRIAFNLGSPYDDKKDYYHMVFPENVGKAYSEKWILERTLFRPRELLQLSRIYTESLTGNTPDAKKLKGAEKVYSAWKLSDLCSEFYEQYPELNKVFDRWRQRFFRHKYHLDYDDVEKVIKDIYENVDLKHQWYIDLKSNKDIKGFVRILYDIGFFGDFALGGNGGTKVRYSYEDNGAPILSSVQIHPCFRVEMNTVERERRKKIKP